MRCLSIILSFSLVITISLQDCPAGWKPSEVVSNKCYYVGVTKDTWFGAEGFCKNANGYLTTITSAFENGNVDAVVISTPAVSDCDQFWYGANAFSSGDGSYGWVDGTPAGYANWASGQPDNNQQCVSSTARVSPGYWRTEPCGVENCFVCEMFMGGPQR
uniref:C-type lectin domain-containing protein n=1 Tax=Plectus sambesii TaxID=2011161 RepID=A0A914XII6_9BILA